MSKILALGIAFLATVQPAAADLVCPDSSYVQVDMRCTFTGTFRPGEPKSIVTVSPLGNGETLAENGILIRVYLRNCQGEAVVGVPPESISLDHPYLCVCIGGTIADGPTDKNGMTTFSGTLAAGGCVPHLILEVEGVGIGTVPVGTNSPDNFFAWPCVVGADELAYFASAGPCFDFNEDGSVDVIDWGVLTSRYLSSNCESAKNQIKGQR